jgi:NAD(P)-dependent dehydrogenase (short-subunit alcohol dehydrogenase family)
MEHAIALVTGTTSGLGYAAARLLAIEGCAVIGSPDAALLKIAEGMFKACSEKGKAGA